MGRQQTCGRLKASAAIESPSTSAPAGTREVPPPAEQLRYSFGQTLRTLSDDEDFAAAPGGWCSSSSGRSSDNGALPLMSVPLAALDGLESGCVTG